MKRAWRLILLFITCGNFLVFLLGAAMYAGASAYETNQQDNYALDSAAVLSVRAREDAPDMPLLEQEFEIAGRKAGYSMKQMEGRGDYLKVYLKKGNEIIYREYVRQKDGKPAVIPAIKAASPLPTPTTTPAETVIEIPALPPGSSGTLQYRKIKP
jgi:hypothetical protein